MSATYLPEAAMVSCYGNTEVKNRLQAYGIRSGCEFPIYQYGLSVIPTQRIVLFSS